MGTDLYAIKPYKILQLGKRSRNKFNNENDVIDSFQIYSDWRDSEIDTWPIELQYFWFKIYDYESAKNIIINIKKYYPKDKDLLNFATWLEKFDKDIIFKLSF